MNLWTELKRRNVFRMAILYGVAAWLLLQVGDVLFGLLGVPDWSLRLLLGILLLGFPVALIFSWVFELTPEGLKKEREVDHGTSISGHTAKKLDLAVIGLGVVALAVFGADRAGWIPHGAAPAPVAKTSKPAESKNASAEVIAAPAPEDSSIAVLPFVNMSSDPEQEYFSDGLAESLLHLLAQIRELRVAARTSSFRFKNHAADISDIGRQLNVAHVLEGSVRRSGDTLRVTAQLIKVDDGYHLWSGTYDRQMDDIFVIQDDIARRVVDALKSALLGEGVQVALPTQDTEILAAYEAFLRGREQLYIDAYVSLPKAESWFQKALEIDPNYELAMISLGETYVAMASTGQITNIEAAERLQPLGQKILQRNPDSAPGRVLLGWAQVGLRQDPKATEALFRGAYESDPDDSVVALHYGRYLSRIDRLDQAAKVLERALIRDPMSLDLLVSLALNYARIDPDKALLHAARAQALEPENPNPVGVEAIVHSDVGHYVAAIDAWERARLLDPADPELPAVIALNLVAFGQFDDARRYIELGRNLSPVALVPLAAEAALLQRQGNGDQAAQVARRIIDDGIASRRWGLAVVLLVLQDDALRHGDASLFLDPVSTWLRVDFDSPAVANGADFFAKLQAVPILRMQGRDDLAEKVIASAQPMVNPDEPRDLAILAMAAQDAERLLDHRAKEHGYLLWMFMQSKAVRDLVGDHPRYRDLMEKMKQNEREQARLWTQYQATGQ